MIQSFKMAWKSISGNKFRAFLTMLGIIIGVMALVILVSLVNGVTGSVTDTISSLGSNLLSVTISDDKGVPVGEADLQEWQEDEAIGLIAPVAQTSMTGKYESTNESLIVYGTTPYYTQIHGGSILLGRFLKTSDVENHTYVCVLGESAAEELVGYTECIGEEVSLNGVKFEIVGVLASDDDSLMSALGGTTYEAYVPYTSLSRVSDSVSSEITSFYVSAADGVETAAAETVMTDFLLERLNEDEDAFSVVSTDALEDAMSSVTSLLTVLLGSIAAISLVVGGIGIMNIMLVTVTERTREIGIRKAVGADRRDILVQFLLESVVLCMFGCAIGIFLSWGVLRVATVIVSGLSLAFSMQGNVVLISVVFCFLIGVVFGLYPANKAAKMAPIDALHYGG